MIWAPEKNNYHDFLIAGSDMIINGRDPFLFQSIPARIRNRGAIDVKIEFALDFDTTLHFQIAQLKLKNTLSSPHKKFALAKALEILKNSRE